jgi:hypothetical protein
MPDKPKLIYYGDIKVADGKYTDKEGAEKTRYITLGKVYHSPHMSRMSFYINPTAISEGKWLNAYPHDEYTKPEDSKDEIAEVDDGPINLNDIPF